MTPLARWLACVLILLALAATGRSQDDGLRAVQVERFGVTTRVPQAWRLTAWNENDVAFELRLPQAERSGGGFVRCQLGLAPERLELYDRKFVEDHEQAGKQLAAGIAPWPHRKLLASEIVDVAPRYGQSLAERFGRWLTAEWQCEEESGTVWFEWRVLAVADNVLYTFTLASDEAHYDAFRADFDDMLGALRITPPDTGLEPLPGGYWMQRQFRFALRLPEGWKPTFGSSDRALFFATGAVRELLTDSLQVRAMPLGAQNLEELKQRLPEQITAADPQARVDCRLVRQGEVPALETVIHTRQGTTEITILERRFTTAQRGYELRIQCDAAEFQRREAELRTTLDSFVEATNDPPATQT